MVGPNIACPSVVLPLCNHSAVRKKRSISMPEDLDSAIEAAAAAEGMTYGGWLADVPRKEFLIARRLGTWRHSKRSTAPSPPTNWLTPSDGSTRRVKRSARSGAKTSRQRRGA